MPRLRLLALTLGLLAAAAAPTARADGGAASQAARVTLAPSDGGAVRSLALADLSARFDVHGRTYRLRDVDGSERTVAVADGISLNALLAAAGLDGDAFDYIAIPGASGSRAIVMRDDLGGADDGPPVVWSDAEGLHFLRPSSGSGDANAVDYVTPSGATLALRLRRGQPLEPRIAVSTLRARPRERIDFRASVAGGGPLPAGLAYQWYFDGSLATGASVSHRFAGSGTYQVLLNVARGQTTIGDPAVVFVHVARARERHADPTRDSGTTAGGASGRSGSPGASGGTGAGASGGVGTGTRAEAAGTAGAEPSARSAAPAVRAQRPAPTRARTPRGALVSGTLLVSASPVAAPAGGAQTARAAVARRAASAGPLRLPVGAWVAIGLLALLALGWVLESRHTTPFWQP